MLRQPPVPAAASLKRSLLLGFAIATATTACSEASGNSTSESLQNAPLDARMAHVRELLGSTPVMDGHNDLPWAIREDSVSPMDVDAYDLREPTRGMTDLVRLQKGMVGAQFWSVYTPGEFPDSGYARVQLEQIDIARRMIERYPEALTPAYSAADTRKAIADNHIASLLGLEGGHAIENSLGALRAYYDLGVRYMTLTHNVTLDWADAALDAPKHGGLTPFGREVVREMNRLGMLVDLSHVSAGTMSDALDVTEAPVIFSHSSARAITDVARNVPDSILARVKTNGGVVMVTFVPSFVSQKLVDHNARLATLRDSLALAYPKDTVAQNRVVTAWLADNPAPAATISDVADHLDHIKKVAGSEHVGLGGDFDGITQTVEGLSDVSTYPALFAELVKRGWTDAELRGLASENVLRVMEEAEAVARRLREERLPSTATIRQLDSAGKNQDLSAITP